MLLTSLTPKHMYSYISETNFESSTIIIVSTGYSTLSIIDFGTTTWCFPWGRRLYITPSSSRKNSRFLERTPGFCLMQNSSFSFSCLTRLELSSGITAPTCILRASAWSIFRPGRCWITKFSPKASDSTSKGGCCGQQNFVGRTIVTICSVFGW